MSGRRFPRLMRAWRAAPVVQLAAVLMAIGAGQGCVRTTSLGRGAATDAPIERHDGPADRQEDRGTDDGRGEHEPQADARPDPAIDGGPIVGGGRDSSSDGEDEDGDGHGGGSLPDAAMD